MFRECVRVKKNRGRICRTGSYKERERERKSEWENGRKKRETLRNKKKERLCAQSASLEHPTCPIGEVCGGDGATIPKGVEWRVF